MFDLKQGYCDYFATAMVVLARLNGIPARLAVGYTMGQFDPQRGDYRVTELNAHSWPELYFPGYGWIPFEPTSAQAVPERTESAYAPPDWAERMPQELASQMGELRAAATENASTQRRWLVARSISGTASGLLFCLYAAALLWLLRGPRVDLPSSPGPRVNLARRTIVCCGGAGGWAGPRGRLTRRASMPWRWRVWRQPRRRGRAFLAAPLSKPLMSCRSARPRWLRITRLPSTDRFRFQIGHPTATAADTAQWAGLWGALRRLWLARLSSRLAARQRSQS